MINALINGLLNVINGIISVIFAPIDALINSAFPNASVAIQTATNFVDDIFLYLEYPFTFLPQNFIAILLIIFTFNLALIISSASYKGFIKLYVIIQKIKFW